MGQGVASYSGLSLGFFGGEEKKKKPKHIYKDYWGSRLAKHGEGIEETEFGGRVRKGAGEPGVLA